MPADVNFSYSVIAARRGVFGLRPAPGRVPYGKLAKGGVLYPFPDELDAKQFGDISLAAVQQGDEEFFLSYAERTSSAQEQDFVLKAFDYDGYIRLAPSGLDHVLVSPRRRWGVFVLYDGIAIVTGNEDFVRVLYEHQRSSEDQAAGFVHEIASIKMPSMTAWATELLSDVFGRDTAVELVVRQSGLQ